MTEATHAAARSIVAAYDALRAQGKSHAFAWKAAAIDTKPAWAVAAGQGQPGASLAANILRSRAGKGQGAF